MASAQIGDDSSTSPAIELTLRRAIAIAREQSPSALAATHRYRASHWQYVTFKADYRPSLDLDTTPIDWDRTISEQTLPDGTDAFVPRSQANSRAGLSLNKVVSFTGGRIALRSAIARTEDLEGDGVTQYSSTPVKVEFSQPLRAFNSYAWGLRIEPKRYREARQSLVEELENVTSNAIAYFFDLLSSQTALRDASTERAHAETLLAVTRRRRAEGRAREGDVLQAELAHLNADLRVTRASVDVAFRRQRLGTYLGVGDDPSFVLVPALDVPEAEVDLATAFTEAKRNRPLAMSFERQLLEADRSVAFARASRGTTSLYASYGLSQASGTLAQVYRDPRVDQTAELSIRVPILDWGRARARIAVAESQREVTRRQVEQSRADFERETFLRVSQFDIQARQFRLAQRADSVAERRHRVTRELYLAGKDDLNSVNIAQNEKDSARRAYIDAMRSYWMAYYDVRRATLYDFERREPLRPPRIEF